MSDYADILDKSWEEIPEVAVLPVGSYLLRARNAVYQEAKSADGNPSILFVYSVKEAMDDVDVDELAELGSDYDLSENRVFARFWLETAADFDKVRKHIEKHGVKPQGSVRETLESFKGHEIIAYLEQHHYTDKMNENQTDNRPSQFAPVEE